MIVVGNFVAYRRDRQSHIELVISGIFFRAVGARRTKVHAAKKIYKTDGVITLTKHGHTQVINL